VATPRALTAEQRRLLHEWFAAGHGERSAHRLAEEAGWVVSKATIGTELRLWRAGATRQAAAAAPAPEVPDDLTVGQAQRRALRALLQMVEDPLVEPNVRVAAGRALFRDARVEDEGDEEEDAAGVVSRPGAPFIVEARN